MRPQNDHTHPECIGTAWSFNEHKSYVTQKDTRSC